MPISNEELDIIILELINADNPDVAPADMPTPPDAKFEYREITQEEYENKMEKIILNEFLWFEKDQYNYFYKNRAMMEGNIEHRSFRVRQIMAIKNAITKIMQNHYPTNKGGQPGQPNGSALYQEFRAFADKNITQQSRLFETTESIEERKKYQLQYLEYKKNNKAKFDPKNRNIAKQNEYEYQTAKIDASLEASIVEVDVAFEDLLKRKEKYKNWHAFYEVFTAIDRHKDRPYIIINPDGTARDAQTIVFTCAKIAYLKYSNWKDEHPNQKYYDMTDLEFYLAAVVMFAKVIIDTSIINKSYQKFIIKLTAKYGVNVINKTMNAIENSFLEDFGVMDTAVAIKWGAELTEKVITEEPRTVVLEDDFDKAPRQTEKTLEEILALKQKNTKDNAVESKENKSTESKEDNSIETKEEKSSESKEDNSVENKKDKSIENKKDILGLAKLFYGIRPTIDTISVEAAQTESNNNNNNIIQDSAGTSSKDKPKI